MTVEYFTPSEEDIEQAPLLLIFYKRWGHHLPENDMLPDQTEMYIVDFTDCFTPEERQAHRNWLTVGTIAPKYVFPSPENNLSEHKDITIEFSSMMNFGHSALARDLARKMITPGTPKDFSPGATQSVLSDAQVNPDYRVNAVKDINGYKVTFYGQELPKDKL